MACWQERATNDFDEQAARVMLSYSRPSSGVLYARHRVALRQEKDVARDRIRNCLRSHSGPKTIGLRLLTMPGLEWKFERDMFRGSVMAGVFRHAFRVTALERERSVYLASLSRMPKKLSGLKYTGNVVSSDLVTAYHRTSVEEFSLGNAEDFDFAWLDYTGPMRMSSLQAIKRLWPHITWVLALTVLNARYDCIVGRAMRVHGGLAQWLQAELPSAIICDDYHYGSVAMQQVVLQKSHVVAADSWICN